MEIADLEARESLIAAVVHPCSCLDDSTTDPHLLSEVRMIVFDDLLVARVPVLVGVRWDCSCPNEECTTETDEADDPEESLVPPIHHLRTDILAY